LNYFDFASGFPAEPVRGRFDVSPFFWQNITTGRIRNGLPFDGFHKHELILKGYFGVVLNVAVWPGTGFDKININTERFKVG
jgi:hypothetical protein